MLRAACCILHADDLCFGERLLVLWKRKPQEDLAIAKVRQPASFRIELRDELMWDRPHGATPFFGVLGLHFGRRRVSYHILLCVLALNFYTCARSSSRTAPDLRQ